MRAWSADFARDLELEVFALADVADAGVAQRVQRIGDGLPLRVEDRRLQRDEHARFHLLLCQPSPRARWLTVPGDVRLHDARRTPGAAAPRKHPIENRVHVAHLIVQVERLLDLGGRQARVIRSGSASSSDLKSRCS